MPLKLNSSSGGSVTLQEPTTASNRTLTLPDATGTVIYSDASGNVGIGTSSPSVKLTINQGSTGTYFRANASTADRPLTLTSSTTSSNGDTHTLKVDSSTGVFAIAIDATERARIDSSGNLLVGTTNTSATAGVGMKFIFSADASNPVIKNVVQDSSGAYSSYNLYATNASAYRFYVTTAGVINATSTSITGISDARLKENVVSINNGLETIGQLNPVVYNFKNLPICDDGSIEHYGFLAQEVQTVLPTLVSESLNEADDGTKYLNLKMGDMLPILCSAIKEQQAMIEELKAKVAALEAK
jgi:hypothetical protein